MVLTETLPCKTCHTNNLTFFGISTFQVEEKVKAIGEGERVNKIGKKERKRIT